MAGVSDDDEDGAGEAGGRREVGSAAVFQEALATLRAGFVLLDEQGRPLTELDPALVEMGIRDFSPATLERFRRTAVDVDGRPLGPDYTPFFDAVFRDIPMNDVVIGFPVEAAETGHATRWVRFNSRRLLVDGQSRVLVTAVDVTQVREAEDRRRELEAAVAAEQRRFAVVFEHIGDVITVFDEKGEVRFGTPSAGRVLGWPAGYRSDGGILGLVHPDDRERAAVALQAVVDGMRSPTDAIIVRIQTAWGDWRYMECVGVNMLDEPSIEGIVVTARDVTERHRLTMALEHAATHDQLTGLPNRAMFVEHLAAALSRTERNETRVALCYIDVDGFKRVNDLHGHTTGDLLLEEIAHRIRRGLRQADVPSRLGGDEFALILEDVDRVGAMNVARRLVTRLRSPFELGGITVRCSASIGVAFAEPQDTTETWVARADAALYQAKRDGGGVARLADPPAPDVERLRRAGA